MVLSLTRRGITALVVCALVLGAVPVGTVVGDPTTVAFDRDSFATERGDIGRITVNFADTRSGTLTIVGPNGDTANVTVSDGNRDEQATLLVNTYARGTDSRFSTPNEADYTYIHDAFAESGTLPAGEYEVRLRSGYGMDSDVVDTVPLYVREPAPPSVSIGVAPERTYGDLKSPAAIRSSRVTNGSTVAVNDTAVIRLNASGIEGRLAVREGSTPEERFRSLLNESGFGLAAVQTNAGASALEKHLRLFGPGTRFVADARNDSYYVVLDTGRVATFRPELIDDGELEVDDRYRVNATISNRTARARFRVVERDVSFVSPPATRFVRPAADQPVWLETTLAPGSDLTLVAHAGNRTARTPVRAGAGRFVAPVDATNIDENATLNLSVTDGERVLARSEFAVTSPEATVLVAGVQNGSTAEIGFEATVSHPSVVVAHRGNASGAVLDTVAVAPDDESGTLSFEPSWTGTQDVYVVAYVDVDGDGALDTAVDARYAGDSALARTAVSPTVTTTTTTSATTTTTSATTTTTTGSSPGFGVVAVLLAVSLVALARRKSADE